MKIERQKGSKTKWGKPTEEFRVRRLLQSEFADSVDGVPEAGKYLLEIRRDMLIDKQCDYAASSNSIARDSRSAGRA